MILKEELEDTKEVIRILKSKDRQHNCHRKNDKKTNKGLQNTTQKIKDRITRAPHTYTILVHCRSIWVICV